ncbi:hypothetical protein ABB27_18715, partial [Stenotrophomonas terrae]
MKKCFYALTLAAFSLPVVAQDAQFTEQPVVAQEPQAIEQPVAEHAVAEQGHSVAEQQEPAPQDPLSSPSAEEPIASFEQPAGDELLSIEQEAGTELAMAEESVSTELAGTEEAGKAARGSLSRLTIGASIHAGEVQHSVRSNDAGSTCS